MSQSYRSCERLQGVVPIHDLLPELYERHLLFVDIFVEEDASVG